MGVQSIPVGGSSIVVSTRSSGGSVSPPSNPSSGSGHAITHTQRGGSSTGGSTTRPSDYSGYQQSTSGSGTPAPGSSGGKDPFATGAFARPNSGGGGGGSGGSKPKSGISAETLLSQSAYGGTGGGTDGEGDTNAGASGGTGSAFQYLGNGAAAAHTQPELPDANPERVNHVDTQTLQNMLKQIVDLQTEQANKQIDYSVERGTNELNRAMEDAAKQYQTQRDQAAADEAQALDNQALYAEARGDRGGIGAAQYASIQNTAAQNRRAVNDAQVKLGTDTARQIADLRSQGEFQKADQLLSVTQSYLAQLKDLEQWALGTNLGVDEFNSQLQQWVDEYNLKRQQYLADLDLSTAQVTGMFADGTKTLQYQNALIQSLANSGNALLQSGVMPSRQQLEAMGMTEEQAKAYFNVKKIKY